MIKILVFIGLKLVEVGGVIFVPYFLGVFIRYLRNELGSTEWEEDKVILWMGGITALIIIAVICVIICYNWNLAGKLIGG